VAGVNGTLIGRRYLDSLISVLLGYVVIVVACLVRVFPDNGTEEKTLEGFE
jgi:hypothetical protein